jgi:single-strand DNA-binding protein
MQGTMQLLGGRPQNDGAPQGQGGGGYQNSAPRPQQSRPQQSAPQQQPQRESRPAPQQQAPQPAADFDSFDDDIPF